MHEPQSLSINKNSEAKFEESHFPELDGEIMEVPDGGMKAWLVCITACLAVGTIFFILNSFGVMYQDFQNEFLSGSDTEKGFKTSSIWSLGTGLAFGLSPVASILIDKFGIRQVSFVGGLLSCSGMLLTSFMPSYHFVYLTYGVIFGCGICVINNASLVIMGHYFKKRLGLANGLAMTGSGCFLIVAPYLHKLLIKSIGLRNHLRLLSGMLSLFMVYAIVWKPTFSSKMPIRISQSQKIGHQNIQTRIYEYLNKVIRFETFKNQNYVVWTIGMLIAHFGYFIPFVHLVKYVEMKSVSFDGPGLLTAMSVASLISRIGTGLIADHPKVSRISLMQISFVLMGCCTAIFPLVNNFIGLVVLISLIGLSDGCLMILFVPVAFDLVGQQGASQAIGFLMGLCAIPMITGPAIAGLLFDRLGSYDITYYLAGIPPLIGANVMFFIRQNKKIRNPNMEKLRQFGQQNDQL